jgi:hypothetical protein
MNLDIMNDYYCEELEEKQYDINIEPESYWPERQLGSFDKIIFTKDEEHYEYEENFPLFVFYYIKSTHKTTNPHTSIVELDNYELEPSAFFMIPLSEDVWVIFAKNDEMNLYPQYSIIQFKGNKVVQLLDWQIGYQYREYIDICGVYDVNYDGFNDVVLSSSGIPATHISSDIKIYSMVDDELIQLEFNINGLNDVEYFYGFDGSYIHFGTLELGIVPFDSKLDRGGASGRFSCIHIMEARDDGYIYDVTYQYPNMEKGMSNSYCSFRDLTYFESIGRTRDAQNKLLECLEQENTDTKDTMSHIIKDCMNMNMPFHVQSKEDIPTGWDYYHVYR